MNRARAKPKPFDIMFQLPTGSWGELLLTSRLSIFRVQLRHRVDLSTLRIHHRSFRLASGLLYYRQYRNLLVSFLVFLRLRYARGSPENIPTGAAVYTRKCWESGARDRRGHAGTVEGDPYFVAGVVDRNHDVRQDMGALRLYHSWTNVHEDGLRV